MYNGKLKEAITNSGMTQEVLAEKIGVTPARISQIVTGNYSPTIEQKRIIAKVLRVTQKSIFG